MIWKEVVAERRTESGIAVIDGRVTSILGGSALHADAIVGSMIHYDVPLRPFYRRSIEALEATAAMGGEFTVYWKMGSNEWENLGRYRITEIRHNKHSVRFELIESGPPQR